MTNREKRLKLQSTLETILGVRHVYYQPPENLKIEYPAIIYSLSKLAKRTANDNSYFRTNRYEIIVVDSKPDNPVIESILMLPYTTHDRNYKSDNMYHDVFTIEM